MSERAEEIAERFERANAQLISTVEKMTDKEWQTKMDAEGWPIGVGVCHLAEHHTLLTELLMSVANGGTLPDWTPKKLEDLDALNAQIAARNAGRSKPEGLNLLRRNGAAPPGSYAGCVMISWTERPCSRRPDASSAPRISLR